MSADKIDHKALGRSRIITQYTGSTRFLKTVEALLSFTEELEDLFINHLSKLASIDDMGGVNLDVIGDIVGSSRVIPDAIPIKYFGFEGFENHDRFGEEGRPEIGSRFREEGEPDGVSSVLNNIDFRILIRAQIAKNHSKGTHEDLLQGLSYLFNVQQVNVDNLGGLKVGISIGRFLTRQEKALISELDLLPRAAGVAIVQKVNFDAANYFGFEGQPGALGFGEEGIPGIGGRFAEEF